MKKTLTLLAASLVFLAGTATSRAVVFDIDLSPVGGTALNLGAPATWYFGDHAIGLAAPNEGPGAPPPSPATGNELGLGIMFDSVTKALSFHVGYGSVFGFTDLAGSFGAAHLHVGPVLFPAPNAAGGVIGSLAPAFHTPAGPVSGSFFGTLFLTPALEGMLFDNLIYWNIHSTAFPGGEIRGQLVVVPEPSAAMLLLLGVLAIPLRRRR